MRLKINSHSSSVTFLPTTLYSWTTSLIYGLSAPAGGTFTGSNVAAF